jgi:hypothetical protein
MKNLICPRCNLVQPPSVASARPETCPRCARAGRQVYMASAEGMRNPGRRPLIRPTAKRRANAG